MPLDFAYAPKFAPTPLAGGGGNDRSPPPGQVTAYGSNHEAPIRNNGAPMRNNPPAYAQQTAPVRPAHGRKLELALRRYAHKRMTEARAQFAAERAAFEAAQAALTVSTPAPVIVREYQRARLCDGSCGGAL